MTELIVYYEYNIEQIQFSFEKSTCPYRLQPGEFKHFQVKKLQKS